MPNLPNGSKGGFEPGLTWLRVRHSTTELPRSLSESGGLLIKVRCALLSLVLYSLFSVGRDQRPIIPAMAS